MKPVALTLLALALTGCSMAPTYERPAAPVPAAYDTPAQSGQAEMPQDWKDYFNDPALQGRPVRRSRRSVHRGCW